MPSKLLKARTRTRTFHWATGTELSHFFWGGGGEAYLSIENTLNGNRPRRSIDPEPARPLRSRLTWADVCVHSDHCGGSWPKTSAAVTSRAMVGPAPRARPPLDSEVDTRKDSHWHAPQPPGPPLRLHARWYCVPRPEWRLVAAVPLWVFSLGKYAFQKNHARSVLPAWSAWGGAVRVGSVRGPESESRRSRAASPLREDPVAYTGICRGRRDGGILIFNKLFQSLE